MLWQSLATILAPLLDLGERTFSVNNLPATLPLLGALVQRRLLRSFRGPYPRLSIASMRWLCATVYSLQPWRGEPLVFGRLMLRSQSVCLTLRHVAVFGRV